MMLIKFIRFPLPTSPAQPPAATDAVLSTSTSKLPASQHPLHPTGPRPSSTPSAVFTFAHTSPNLSSPQPRPSLFPASPALPSSTAGPHSHPLTALPPPAITSAPSVPRLLVLESQGQAGSGQKCKALCPPHSCAVLCHPGRGGTLPEPRS